ncbi:MAG: hypothetical protein ABIP29_05520 [Candidatus Eisenbacteria bacterium]
MSRFLLNRKSTPRHGAGLELEFLVTGKDADPMRLVNALCRFVEMATEV